MAGGLTERRRDQEIVATCARLRTARTRADLGAMIHREISRYTLYDLQALRGMVERDLRHVPRGYARQLYPRLMEQIFSTYHTLILSVRNGVPAIENGPLSERFSEFCDMVERTCIARETEEERRSELLYFLLSAYNIFVREYPGHPVGTPFPGGLKVEMRDGEYLCPIRERADDVENALCPYCPAKQHDMEKS
jgi:uncharacterized protein (UPF0305 family)